MRGVWEKNGTEEEKEKVCEAVLYYNSHCKRRKTIILTREVNWEPIVIYNKDQAYINGLNEKC